MFAEARRSNSSVAAACLWLSDELQADGDVCKRRNDGVGPGVSRTCCFGEDERTQQAQNHRFPLGVLDSFYSRLKTDFFYEFQSSSVASGVLNMCCVEGLGLPNGL